MTLHNTQCCCMQYMPVSSSQCWTQWDSSYFQAGSREIRMQHGLNSTNRYTKTYTGTNKQVQVYACSCTDIHRQPHATSTCLRLAANCTVRSPKIRSGKSIHCGNRCERGHTLVGVARVLGVPPMLVAGVARETRRRATAVCIGALVVAPIARGVEVGRLGVHVGGIGGGLGGPPILIVLAHAGWQPSWSSIWHLQHSTTLVPSPWTALICLEY